MITFKCDICQKNRIDIKSMILHKKTIDYCTSCEKKAKQIKEDFKKEVKQEYISFEERLKKRERTFYDKRIKETEENKWI